MTEIKNWNEVDLLIRRIAKRNRRIERIRAAAEAKVEIIRADMTRELDPLQSESSTWEGEIEVFTRARAEDFAPAKSKKLTSGTVGLKDQPARFLWPEDLVLVVNLTRLGKRDYCRISESPDKTAIIRDYESLPLRELGIKRVLEPDRFYLRINRELIIEEEAPE